MQDIKILYEDEYILVIHKPAGIPTETKSVGVKDLRTILLKYRKSKGQSAEIFIIHRLDQPVSGLMVLAKDSSSAALLSGEDYSTFGKTYKALVYGKPSLDNGKLVDYLIKNQKTNTSSVSDKENKSAKRAVLEYSLEKTYEETSLLKVRLSTGRHHQIRLQLSNAGIPIVGDSKYGSEKSMDYSKSHGARRVYLCAVDIEFTHPVSKEKMHFTIDEDF